MSPLPSGARGLHPGNLPTGKVPDGETALRLGAQKTQAERAAIALQVHLARPVAPVEAPILALRLWAAGEKYSDLGRGLEGGRGSWRTLQDVLQTIDQSPAGVGPLSFAQKLAVASHFVDNIAVVERALELHTQAPIELSAEARARIAKDQSMEAFFRAPDEHRLELIAFARQRPSVVDLLLARAPDPWFDPAALVVEIGFGAIPVLVKALGAVDAEKAGRAAECLAAFGRLARGAASPVLQSLSKLDDEAARTRRLEVAAALGGPVSALNEAQLAQILGALKGTANERFAAGKLAMAMAPELDRRVIDVLPRDVLAEVLPALGRDGWRRVNFDRLCGCEKAAVIHLGPPPEELVGRLLDQVKIGRFSPLVRYALDLGPLPARRAAVERLLGESRDFVRNAEDLAFMARLAATLPHANELRGRILAHLTAAKDNLEEPTLRAPAFRLLLPLLPIEGRVEALQVGLRDPILAPAAIEEVLHHSGKTLPKEPRQALLTEVAQVATEPPR